MVLTDAFYEAVNSNNVHRVRIMMKDSLLVDPSFRQFNEMQRVAKSMKGLYESHDGRMFELSEEKWDNNYMNKQMVQVIGNFSHERIKHLKDVVRRLRPVVRTEQVVQKKEMKRNNSTNKNTTLSYKEQKRHDQQNGRYLGTKHFVGACAGAVVGGAVASAVGVTVVGGALTGAVVGGAVASVVMSGGN